MNAAIWERHARARIAAGDLHRPPGHPRFAWTRTGTDDPGPALLGDIAGRRVVELGCGTGDNLAHLVDHCGARGLGIDAAPSQIRRAQARWPSLDHADTDLSPRTLIITARTDPAGDRTSAPA